jgi:hypothetical protein
MKSARGASGVTVGVILLTILVSGPLVGAIDLTRPTGPDGVPGDGTVTVENVAVAEEETRMYSGRFGAETIYLDVPDARVDTDDVRGRPIVTYTASIPNLSTTSGQTYFLRENSERVVLQIERPAFSPDQVTRDAYDVELEVVVRDSSGEHVVYRETVTAEVER